MPSRPSTGSYPGPVQVPSRVRGGPVQIRHVLCFTVFWTHPGPEVGAIPARPGPILLPSVPYRIGPGRAETDFLATSERRADCLQRKACLHLRIDGFPVKFLWSCLVARVLRLSGECPTICRYATTKGAETPGTLNDENRWWGVFRDCSTRYHSSRCIISCLRISKISIATEVTGSISQPC